MEEKSNKLEVTIEKVLRAAAKCPDAKAVLEEMFPEAFEESKYFNFLEETDETSVFKNRTAKDFLLNAALIEVRDSGEYEGRGFFLDDNLDWELKKDSEGALVLIPKKR